MIANQLDGGVWGWEQIPSYLIRDRDGASRYSSAGFDPSVVETA